MDKTPEMSKQGKIEFERREAQLNSKEEEIMDREDKLQLLIDQMF